MLKVKDFEKLKAHGFTEKDKELNLWQYMLKESEDGCGAIWLLVNPFFANEYHALNEVFIYGDYEGDGSFDTCARFDIIFEMIADGTLEYVKEDK